MLGLLWLVALAMGVKVLTAEKTAPGAMGPSAVQWPTDTHLRLAADRRTVVMFAHPRCPCTRASLAELNAVLNAAPGRAHAIVVFPRPPGAEVGWEESGSWDRAHELPDTTVEIDADGREAQRFGALTSGQVALYGPGGELEFFGGITDARGHEGNNVGRQALLDHLLDRGTNTATHAVFGCELL